MSTFPFEADAGRKALAVLEEGFSTLPAWSAPALDAEDRAVLQRVAGRLVDNFPYHHPLYAGQMLKPPHPVAREAYALAMRLNPNNHALDGGRASTAMEREAVARLATMVGLDTHLGHLTGGGTVANLEALWVAGQLRPGGRVLASAHAHYTHERLAALLGLQYTPVAVDTRGRMDLRALEVELAAGGVSVVVATLGTTGLGAVDPMAGIVERASASGVRVHADAAYGGYFRLLDDLPDDVRRALEALNEADSIVVDPHKHGLQPYGCGCVLFRDPEVGRLYQHDSPYTYFTSDALHLGEISLECSRPGAAAVALWATLERLPLEAGGEFARALARGRWAALQLQERLLGDDRFLTLGVPDLDIIVFAPRAGDRPAAMSAASNRAFTRAASQALHLALIRLPASFLASHWPVVSAAEDAPVTCLRMCLMKPEHADWLEEIWARLEASVSG